MSSFTIAVNATLKREGGFSENIFDNGGATNFGVSLRFYKGVKPDATVQDIKQLTRIRATAIYRQYFWDLNNYELIASQAVASKIFDMAVNLGAETANKMLQRIINLVNIIEQPLKIDGDIGPKTIAAINSSPPGLVVNMLRSSSANYYRLIAEKNTSQRIFLAGWLDRALV